MGVRSRKCCKFDRIRYEIVVYKSGATNGLGICVRILSRSA